MRRRPRDPARKTFDKAFQLIEEGKPDEAEGVARQYAERKSDDPEAHLVLAAVLSARRDNEAAAAEAVRAAELAWDDPAVVYRAASRAVDGDLDSCERLVAHLEFLLRAPGCGARFPFHNELLHLNGAIAIHRGDLKRARAMLTLAYESEPTIVGLGYDLAFVYAQEGRIAEAAAVVADALTYDPDSKRLVELQQELHQTLHARD